MLADIKTIPTIHNIIYLVDILQSMANGRNSFEEIRRKVAETRRNIELRERVGHSLGEKSLSNSESRLSYMWNQTAKNLRELMQLGLVKKQPLKYSIKVGDRADVDADQREYFELTENGSYLAKLAKIDLLETMDKILELTYKVHPKFRDFIDSVQKNGFLFFPELKVDDFAKIPVQPKEYTEYVCGLAGKLVQETTGSTSSESEFASYLKAYVLSSLRKAHSARYKLGSIVTKSLNRGIKALIFKELGLSIDIPSFEVMTNWCKQYRICNFARGLPDMNGLTLYSTAYVELRETLIIERLTKESVIDSVIKDIPSFFFKFKTKGSPWALIYPIRAAICFKYRMGDEVFDEIIRDIFYKRISVDFKLSLESDVWSVPPRSTKPLVLDRQEKRNIVSIYEWKGR